MKESLRDLLKKVWDDTPMKCRYFMFFIFGGMATFLIIMSSGCNVIKDMKEDSMVEEIFEDVIEEYCGLPRGSIDITPNSEE